MATVIPNIDPRTTLIVLTQRGDSVLHFDERPIIAWRISDGDAEPVAAHPPAPGSDYAVRSANGTVRDPAEEEVYPDLAAYLRYWLMTSEPEVRGSIQLGTLALQDADERARLLIELEPYLSRTLAAELDEALQ